jgi:probable phosphoglycerate mutase
MQTADAISAAVGVPYTVVEDFREINVGDLEKHPPTDESWDTYFRVSDAWYNRRMDVPFPGGEDYNSLYGRFVRGLRSVIGSGAENIIIVGHAGIFTFGIMELFHIDDRHAFDAIPNCNCSVTEILLDDEAKPIELVRWADGSHLSGEAAKIVASYPVREVGENVRERIK